MSKRVDISSLERIRVLNGIKLNVIKYKMKS